MKGIRVAVTMLMVASVVAMTVVGCTSEKAVAESNGANGEEVVAEIANGEHAQSDSTGSMNNHEDSVTNSEEVEAASENNTVKELFGAYKGTELSPTSGMDALIDDGWVVDDEYTGANCTRYISDEYDACLFEIDTRSKYTEKTGVPETAVCGYKIKTNGNYETPFSFRGVEFGTDMIGLEEAYGAPNIENFYDDYTEAVYRIADGYTLKFTFDKNEDGNTALREFYCYEWID